MPVRGRMPRGMNDNDQQFRTIITGHLKTRLMDAWRDSTDTFERLPDGTWAPAPYDENMADGSTPVAWEDVADPMDPKPDRAGLQSVIDAIGGHYLHLAREYGWLDTEVRDAVYVETKRRGWCGE